VTTPLPILARNKHLLSVTLYFVRHGETDWNVEARLQGQRDVPLNDFGRVQAEEAARRLRGLVTRYEDLDYVASPLSRTRETMERMRQAAGLHPTFYRVDERLKELSFGAWEGLTWKEVRAREPQAAAGRQRDKWNYAPPGGESYAMLAERVAPAVADLKRDAVMVSHGGVARALLALLGHASHSEAPITDIWQGKILVFCDGDYSWA
jgi:broad specificity phosphatase PhoE